MKKILASFLVFVAPALMAEDVLPLWDETPPFSKPSTLEEYVEEAWGVPCAFNITIPTLTIHPARGDNSERAIVVVPGGGYEMESIIAEGEQIAESLSAQGITAAVLKYRLPLTESSDQPHLVPATDARRALALLRSLAGKYGFDTAKVGILGFSAGGHLAATVSVLPAPTASENPDYSVLVYPATIPSAANREWLEETLFHRQMTEEEIQRYSPAVNVTATTPPAFLVHSYDDDVVPISESETYAEALIAVGQEVEVHYFAKGGHGFGPGHAADGTDQWLRLVANWIRRQ